ncbi:MAG: ABC transporter ATP-binding protein [Clostridia bacterium]|nr:ABC transporter ATP-binding protein [Clostridia bacterium]
MFEIDKIPREVYALMDAKGVREDEILLAAKCDRDRDHAPASVFLFATATELAVLTGTFASAEGGGASPWTEHDYRVYSLAKLDRFRIEELLSSARFTAVNDEGEPVFITAMTNFCRTSMIVFQKYLGQIKRTGAVTVDPDDDPKSNHCPKCGQRYPEKNRKICPRCMEKGKLFTRIASFFLNYKLYLVLSLLSLIGMTALSIWAANLSSRFFIKNVLTDTASPYYGMVIRVLMMILATKLLTMGATIVNNYMTSIIAAKVNFDLKKTIFGAIERLSLGFFTSRQTGGLMTQVNNDANTIYDFFCNILPHFLVNVAKVVVLVVLLFLINPWLALCALLVIPVSLTVMRLSFAKNRKLHARRFSSQRAMTSFLSDELSGMRVVKAFSKENEEIGRFNIRSARLADADVRRGIFNTFISPISGFLLHSIGNLVTLGLGGWLVIKGQLDYPSLTLFIAYIGMIYAPLQFFSEMSDITADCSNSLQRLFEIMDSQTEVREAENPIRVDSFDGHVRFDDVTFSYIKNHRVIDRVSFDIEAGQTLGIVGHTGAGKSTLANLLIRLYDPESGVITIDGMDVKKLSFEDLHRNIAVVSQETYLFMGTILENIRYACPDASYEAVIEAAKAAGAHDFIVKLPDAYETKIGFGYKDLSGGERQRLSIARAILRNPRILILDEATAAMDTETERKIQTALTELVKGKTTIMIAHRLSTLRDADKLIVIEGGKVAESGTHEELMAAEGVYHRLYSLQIEALKNAGIAE